MKRKGVWAVSVFVLTFVFGSQLFAGIFPFSLSEPVSEPASMLLFGVILLLISNICGKIWTAHKPSARLDRYQFAN